jgi:Rieske Fe-S protein
MNDSETRTVAPDGKPLAQQPAWRRDFPIDVPQDNYVARRDFTKFLGLISLAFVVGQFWIGAQNWLRRRRGLLPVQKIASLADLPVGGAMTFTYPDASESCILVRINEQDFRAFNQKCTHLSCAVLPNVADCRLVCPCHHGVFDLASGGPLAGPPRRPLTRILLERRGNDLWAVGMESRTTL